MRDEPGSPIADAYVSIFRAGTSNLLKQVRSAADGSFFAKIIPGTYTVLAVAKALIRLRFQKLKLIVLPN